MARPLRQNTAVTVSVGPAQSPTDGSLINGLTITQSDVLLRKHGVTTWSQKNDTGAATFESTGHYGVPFNTTDTNTLGPMRLAILESGALVLVEDFEVLHPTVYDMWFSTGLMPWNAAWDAEVESEVLDALVVTNLDHLAFTATGIPANPPTGTWLDQVMGSSSGTYSPTVHSLRAAIDNSADMADFGILLNTTIASLTSQTVFVLAGGAGNNAAYTKQIISLFDVSAPGVTSTRRVTDYVGGSLTITLDRAPDFTIAVGDEVRIFVAQSVSMDELVGPLVTVLTDGTNSAISFKTDLPVATNNQYKDAWLYFELDTTTVALRNQVKRIVSSVAATDFVTMHEAYTTIPQAGDRARLVRS